MKKRALSWLLALTMLLTLAPQTLPVWASATGEKSSTATQTESKLSANTYSALGLSRNVADSEKPKDQPYGKAKVGNTIATNVINELYVNFNGSIHYGWSILDNLTMQWTDTAGSNWTSADNFAGAMKYWRPNQQEVHYKNGNQEEGALFATNKTAGKHNKLGDYINSANKHLVYQYSKSEAFSPNTGKDNYVAELVVSDDGMVSLYIYQVEGGNKRYVRGTNIGKNPYVGDASNKTNVIWNWEYDAMFDIAAGDMDGDGYDEIAVYTATGTGSDDQAVHLYKYTGGTLTEITKKTVTKPNNNNAKDKNLKLGTAVVTLAFGDLNADDKDELVIAENMTYGSSNINDGKVGIYALKEGALERKKEISLETEREGNNVAMARYVNVATGDIDNDNQDELIIAGYVGIKAALGSTNISGTNKDNIYYKIIDGKEYKESDWKTTSFVKKDLLGRVVDNSSQLIPPVSLTCAATQGVGYAEQLFLSGCLYSVNKSNYELTLLTQISTNREYKKDNGNKANKEEIFVVNVVAGNFNGNRNGQEQIVYAFGMKHDDSDRYWYDIGYINKKAPGPENANQSSGYWYGQEQVMNYESSYNRDQNKSRASLYLSLAAVDCDNDSTLMRYKGQTVTWTKPEVLTVLQSAPYFQDLEDTRGYLDQGQTGLGKSKAVGDKVTAGGSLSLGTYVSFEQDFSVFGVKVASIEAEAQSKNSFTYAYEETKKKETEINYSGSAGDDYAVVYAVPYMEYQYETWVPGYTVTTEYLKTYLADKLGKAVGNVTEDDINKAMTEFGIKVGTKVEGSWQPSSVMVPMEPAKVLITVDDYDEIAEQTEGLEPIRGNILNSTPGDPSTYDNGENPRDGFTPIGEWQTVTKGAGGNITVTETSTTEKSHDFEYSYEFEAKVGAGAGGLTVGVLAGYGTNVGGGTSSSSSKSYSATVDNLPKDADGYGFSWRFGYRKAKLNNNDVLVLEYEQKGTYAKPSPPKNLRVESVTSNSVTLSWDPVTGAGAYKIYQLDSTGKTYRMKTLAGTATSWTNTGLSSNTSYTYVAKTITQDGQESLTSASVHAGTLEKDKENFKILTQPTDQTSEATAGSQLQFTVTAEYRNDDGRQNELNYQWETYNTTTRKWETVNGAESQTLTVTVTDQNDGKRYRCQVYSSAILYLYSKEVTLKVGRSTTETSLTATPTGVIKSAYMEEQEEYVTENGQQVYEQKAKTEGEYTLYSYSYQDTDDQTQKVTVYAKKTGTATDYYASKTDTQPLSKATKKILTYGDSSQDITTIGAGESVTDKAYTVTQEEGGGSEAAVTYTATTKYKLDTDGKKILYYCPANTTDKTEAFWFVEVTDKGTDGQNTTTTYYAEVEDVVKLQVTDTLLIDEDQLQLETVDDTTKPVKRTVQVNQDGDTVTLTANVEKKNTGDQTIDGSVTFKIVNTTGDGGVTETVQVGTDGKATMNWKPTTAGVYVVTAIYSGSEMFKESQSQSYTINVVTPGEQKLVLSGENMTYGDTQELKATLFDGKSDSESTTGVSAKPVTVTYAVTRDGTAVTDEITAEGKFTPTQAGTYTITATYTPANTSDATTNNSITTTKVIVVGRKTVKIVPKVVQGTDGKTITYDLPGVPEADQSAIRAAIVTSCTGLTNGAKAGIYPIVVKYNENNSINSKYLIVCDNDQKYEVKGDVVHVTNATTDSNGKVKLQYTDSKGNTYDVGENGQSLDVPKGVKLTATAMPNLGYRVEQWKVNSNTQMNGVTPVTNPTFEIQIPENTTLENWTVEATFTQIYYKLNYSIENGGEITAKYLTDNGGTGTPFNSGDQLSPLQKVQLTAKPASGQAICEWQVDGETIKNKDGTNYTGATYEVSSISKETSIVVKTEQTSECPVTVTVVGSDNQPLGNATVSFNPAREATDGTYPGQKNQSLTITLNIPDSLIVESWSTAAGQEMQGTLSSDKKKLTISNLRSALNLTVKCVTPNMYTVTQAVNAGGRIEVYKGLTDNTPLSFTDSEVDVPQASLLRVLVKPDDGYQVKSVTVGETAPTLNDIIGSEDKSFVINSVDRPTTIHVEFVKKPVVTFTAGSKGTIEVSNGPSVSGGTVPYGYKNDIVFTAKPEPDYEVDSWTVTGVTDPQGTPVANSDNQTYTYTPDATTGITSDVTVEVSFKALPKATVEFSVVDKNNETDGGFDGSVTASVTRKGMTTYAEDKTANSTTSTQTLNVYRDSVVTLSAQADSGYVAKWIYGGEELLTPPTLDFSTTDTLKDHEVKVRFDPIGKAITFTKDGDGDHASNIMGSFAADNGSTKEFTSGSIPNTSGTLTLTVTPNDGYEVEGWYVDGTKQADSTGKTTFVYSVTHDVGAVIQVKIIRSSYKVEFSAENGSITASPTIPSDKMVRGDTAVTFTASPARPTGYTFVGWTINGKTPDDYSDTTLNNGDTLTVTIKEAVTVQATYTQDTTRHTVTYGVSGDDLGTLSLNTRLGESPATVANGTTVTFTATPKEGNYVEGWYSDAACTDKISGTGEETSYSVAVYQNTSVYVKFAEKPTYTITLTKNGSGKVFASVNGAVETEVSDSLSVKYHDSVVLRAEAGANDYFAGWKDNTTGNYTIADVTGDTSVTATFAPMQNVYLNAYSTDTTEGTLTATGSVSGSIQTNAGGNGVQVAGGQKITLTANPASSQMVKEWKINGQKVEGNLSNTLVIDSIKASTEVAVEFEEYVGYLIPTTPTPAKGYTVTTVERIPDDTPNNAEIRKGGTVTFMVVPDDGKVFTKLEIGTVNCLTTPSTGNVTAVREGNGYRITVSNVSESFTLTAQATEFQVISDQLTDETKKSELRKYISSSVSRSNIQYLDITLQMKNSSGEWVNIVNPEDFPKGGVYVTISYPNGTDKQDTFYISHMLTVDMNGKKAGEVEEITPITKGENGISFHVTSLSPFAIGWTKYVAPTPGGGGGGGGGAVSTYTLTFDTNGGSAIDKITKDSGTTIDLAAYKPTRAGYTFAGWFSDKALTKAVTSVKLTANTTVYAKWTQNGGTAQNPFVDVKEGAYYYDAVLWAVEQKITSGTSATTFSPDASCTRAQMVTFLWRAAGSPKVENGKNPFTDVQADAYYYDAVLWAVEKGVTSGTSATTFSPDATVTRGQTVTFLYRNAGSPEVSGTMPFTDVEADAYYAKAVQWAVQQKITTGTSETTFSPMSDCTRGQIVTFLYRAK